MLRAYLLGFMICFSFAGGGLVLLMLQYVSGGKWGMLLRRPLEAMSRTLPLVALMIIPIVLLASTSISGRATPRPAELQALQTGRSPRSRHSRQSRSTPCSTR